jgi:uncharacterized membrane protein YccF (DUF307 family)
MNNLLTFLLFPIWLLFTGIGIVVAAVILVLAMAVTVAIGLLSLLACWPFASWILAKEVMR